MKRHVSDFKSFRLNEESTQLGGQSPLDQLCRELSRPGSMRPEMISQLLDAGADPNAYNDRGETPLVCAIKGGEPGAVKVLLDHGADPNQKIMVGRAGMTPLEFTGYLLDRERHDDRKAEAMMRIMGILTDAGAE